jgi:hypothetical protein
MTERFHAYLCIHSGHIMTACNYCDLWHVSIEQTFIENHLLGSDDEIPECENVSRLNKFVSFKHKFITFISLEEQLQMKYGVIFTIML